MALFVDQNRRRKSPLVMYCFLVSLVYLCVYGAVYALMTDLLYRNLSLGGTAATTALHAIVMAAVGAAVCCLAFLLPDKRVAPGAHLCLAALVAVCYLALLLLDADKRHTMFQLVTLYGLAPALVGNAIAWPIYRKLRRTHAPLKMKTLREEIKEAAGKTAPPAAPARPAPAAPAEPALTEDEALFGPEADTVTAPRAFRTAQEEAMLLYEDDETNDD